MNKPVAKKKQVVISEESALSLRLSVVESQLKEILFLLKNPHRTPFVEPEVVQDAIRAHIGGDRGPMDALAALWEAGQVPEGKFSLSCVLGSRESNHG
jgi:hypothetical protein